MPINQHMYTDFDQVLTKLFDMATPAKKPHYLIELDSQDGQMLAHAYGVIQSQTARASQLISSRAEYPLEVVAIILDPAKLHTVRDALANIPHRIVQVQNLCAQTILRALAAVGIVDATASLYIDISTKHSSLADFQEYSSLKNNFGVLVYSDLAHPATHLLDLAKIGWFPQEGSCYGYDSESTLIHYELRPYRVRPATLDDVPIITQIEASNWDEGLRTAQSQIKEWIQKYPEGQLVIESNDGIEGIVYSQKIASIDPLYKIQSEQLHTLFDPTGSIIQLIAIFIKTEKQHSNMGGQLLEFALQKASITPHITHVAGITRCVNYPGTAVISMQEYLNQKNSDGTHVDPVPRMHLQHGAQIKGLVPNYRPNDIANAGFGILIVYDLQNRNTLFKPTHIEKPDVEKITADSIRTFIDEVIIDLLAHCGGLVEEDNSSRYSRTAPLMDMGLDSLQLLELASKIGDKFQVDLGPTFFFQYATAEATIQYLIETKLELYKDWLYEVQWKPSTASIPAPYIHDGLWVVFDDGSKLAELLQKTLEENYQYCIIVKPGNGFHQLSEHLFEVDPNSAQDFKRFFTTIPHLAQLSGAIYLWGYNIPQNELDLGVIESYHKRNCTGFVNLANALALSNVPESSKLWLVNKSIVTDGTNESLLQTPVDVICKVVKEEYPKSQCTHLALDSKSTDDENCRLLTQELLADSQEPQIAYKDNIRIVPRIVPAKIESIKSPNFSPEASYLVMGGLRPLGLQLARWYIAHGAKTVILLDEFELTAEIEAELKALKALGAKIAHYIVNFDNTHILELVFNQIKVELPPLKGAIHAAGVADNELLMHMDWERFKLIYRLKVAGAWNLHLFTEKLDLDHFILFSTPLADIAPLGKANHATGNAFLDALSHLRRAKNLPCLTISWGPWEFRYTVIRHMIDTSIASRLKSITVEEGLKALDHLFYLDKPQITAAQIEWTNLITGWMKDNPILDEIGRVMGLKQDDLIKKYKAVPESEQLEVIENYLQNECKKLLSLGPRKIVKTDMAFASMGLNELQRATLRNEIQTTLKDVASLPVNILEINPTIKQLALVLKPLLDKSLKAELLPFPKTDYEPIAIIGMGCRFPGGADTPEKFWNILKNGIDVVTEVPPDRWDIEAYYDTDKKAPGKMYTRFGGFIDHVDMFDPQFFGISPREAEDMDPQQRISLEVAWEALENAGIAPKSLKGTNTGVFMGICFNDYGQLIMQSGDIDAVDDYYSTGNHYSVAAGRISYVLGLEGPAMAIDTACSSSLVSVDIASEKLQRGECDIALAGGVNLILAPESTINFCKSGMLAEDGRCKTFDAAANGYVRGEGCGIVVLKRLSDAVRDNTPILAVIRATAVNQDGASTGLTVPNGQAQEKVINAALKKANLQANEINYVEAHGTGTSLGDPIEVKAIIATYGKNRQTPLVLGSAKTNIGHTEAAAGVAGLIKCVLALQHAEIPPHLHFHKLNPFITLDEKFVKIPQSAQPWLPGDKKRLAAISSFGFSGTNAHVIIEEGTPLSAEQLAKMNHSPAFQRKRYWVGLSSGKKEVKKSRAEHPLLGYKTKLANNITLYEGDISLESVSFLKDFLLGLEVVYPAALFFEMLFAVSILKSEQQIYRLMNIKIDGPMSYKKECALRTQIILMPAVAGPHQIEIFTISSEMPTWKLYASAKLINNPEEQFLNTYSYSQPSEGLTEITRSKFYENLKNKKIIYTNDRKGWPCCIINHGGTELTERIEIGRKIS